MTGMNYSTVRNEVFLKNKTPLMAPNFGVSVQYYPIKKFRELSVINEFGLSRKGYRQELDTKYSFVFNYLVFPVLINYRPTEHFSVNTGVEFSKLHSTKMPEGTKTYNNFDTGLVLGMNLHRGRIFSIYLRGVYGLRTMLDYYTIDELGNFIGEIHDLKNLCVSAGVKINLYNEKFKTY